MWKVDILLDNDWTLTRFHNWNFSNTIWRDLMTNISEYIQDLLKIDNNEFIAYKNKFKSQGIQYSEWFEQMWIDRNDYFNNTWWWLDPNNYLTPSNSYIYDIIKSKQFKINLITSAPRVWFNKTLSITGLEESDFNHITTWEEFYSKERFIYDKVLENIKEDRDCFALWDQVWDIKGTISNWKIGIISGISSENYLLEYILQYGLDNICMINKWHTGSLLYKLRKKREIVKSAWFSNESKQEIQWNIYGYSEIQKYWWDSVTPKKMQVGKEHIIMPDLGSDVTTEISELNITKEELGEHLSNIFDMLSKNINYTEKIDWYSQIINKVLDMQDVFISKWMISKHDLNELITILKSKLKEMIKYEYGYELMILDFTSDNLFITENWISFIDPWEQDSYLWSSLVSIWQLITNLWIYDFLSEEEYNNYIKEFSSKRVWINSKYSFQEKKKILSVWIILQCLLSSKYRYETKKEQSIQLFNKAFDLIKNL